MHNTKSFSTIIESLVFEKRITYIDAVVHHCNDTGIELETAAKLLNVKIKHSIAEEAENLNMMKEKTNRLPFWRKPL